MPSDTSSRYVKRVLVCGICLRPRCPQALTLNIVLIRYSVPTP